MILFALLYVIKEYCSLCTTVDPSFSNFRLFFFAGGVYVYDLLTGAFRDVQLGHQGAEDDNSGF